MEYILAAEPIKVHGAVVASYGSELSLLIWNTADPLVPLWGISVQHKLPHLSFIHCTRFLKIPLPLIRP